MSVFKMWTTYSLLMLCLEINLQNSLLLTLVLTVVNYLFKAIAAVQNTT